MTRFFKNIYNLLSTLLFFDEFDWNKIEFIDFLKTDCQSNDLNVIKSCGDYLKRICFIQSEYYAHSAYEGEGDINMCFNEYDEKTSVDRTHPPHRLPYSRSLGVSPSVHLTLSSPFSLNTQYFVRQDNSFKSIKYGCLSYRWKRQGWASKTWLTQCFCQSSSHC